MDVNFSLDKIEQIAALFFDEVGNHKVFAFHGEMGAGKTTFIHALCNALKVKDVISSPTFSIINEYKAAGEKTVYHMDLYRLKDTREAIAAGVEDCLYSGDYCFAEWPENAPSIFPDDTVHCYLSSTGNNQRKLQIKL